MEITKDENVHRFVVRDELLEREREGGEREGREREGREREIERGY